MKIASPPFAIALAAAVLAPGIDALNCYVLCTTAIGCSSSTINPAGTIDIPLPNPSTCASSSQKRFIKTLLVSDAGGRNITVAFKHGTIAFGSPLPIGEPGGNSADDDDVNCSWEYEDVGKDVTLSGDVVATVGCATSTACNAQYKATYGCIRSACAQLSLDGSTALPIAATKSAPIPVPASAPTCPYGQKRYIRALTVAEDSGLDISVAFKQGSTAGAVDVEPVEDQTTVTQDNGDPATNNCRFDYADVGKGVTLSDDVIATVTCTGSAACNVKYKVSYACGPKVTCPETVPNTFTTATLSSSTTSFEVKKATPCPGVGQFNYLASLDVRGGVVSFNNDLLKTVDPFVSGATCLFYKDVMGIKANPTDMVATLTCATGTTTCTPKYTATWKCSDPIVYTRTAPPVGENCVKDLSNCDNRCAKSYQLYTKYTAATTNPPADAFTTMTLKPQIVTGCTCPDFTATVTSTGTQDLAAKNTETKMSVQVRESDNTMTIASTDDAVVCAVTYKRVSFENTFVNKPYTRTTPGTDAKCTPDAATASADDLCAFKCAAEISLTKPTTDTIRVTKAAVTGCKCGDPVDMVVDGDGATAGTDALKYKYTKADGILTVTTTTGADDTKLVCDAVYKESCSKLCTDGACGVNDIPTDGLKLKNLDGCPAYTFSYPKSVIVRGLLAENDVSVKSATAVADKTAVKCYKTYGQLGGTLTAISADFTPTVACGTDGCKAAVKTEWGCTAPKCPTVTGLSTKVTMTVPNATGMVVPGPTTACATGLKAYIKSLDIRTAAGKDVVVKFNNGLTPLPSSKGATCTFYSNVISPTAATDVSATINCASTTAADTCDVQYKVEYGCFKPAAATVYTRKGAPDGRGCVTDLSTCASRCAKSYQLIATETEKMLVPQIMPDGCYCPALTATTDATTTTKATNTATTMEVNDGTTMTVEYTAPGKECKTTFAKAAFANSFVAETYARGTVTPATCTPAADADAATTCAYKCAAELSIKPLAMDALNVTQAVVTTPADCTCDPFMAYVDVDGLTASGPLKTSSVEIKQTTGAVTVKTTTGSTVCTATYTKKTAPPPPATTTPSPTTTAPPPATTAKTGTSAGVSALGAGADAGMVTVTLVAAAAGVQAVGLPA